MSGLHAFAKSGGKAGTALFPHRHRDGAFVVSMSRFENDYIRVKSEADLLGWLEKGYSMRMSNAPDGVPAASLVSPQSIYRPVLLK